MALLDTISHIEVAERHRPWPRALVSGEGWRQAIDQLSTGRFALLGLWGDPPMVHMALFDERTVMLRSSVTCANPANIPALARVMRLRSGWNAQSMTYLVLKR